MTTSAQPRLPSFSQIGNGNSKNSCLWPCLTPIEELRAWKRLPICGLNFSKSTPLSLRWVLYGAFGPKFFFNGSWNHKAIGMTNAMKFMSQCVLVWYCGQEEKREHKSQRAIGFHFLLTYDCAAWWRDTYVTRWQKNWKETSDPNVHMGRIIRHLVHPKIPDGPSTCAYQFCRVAQKKVKRSLYTQHCR